MESVLTSSRTFQHPHLSQYQFHLLPTSILAFPFPFKSFEFDGGSRDGERQKKQSTGWGRVDDLRNILNPIMTVYDMKLRLLLLIFVRVRSWMTPSWCNRIFWVFQYDV
jgi:hypothetical protein